jgi:hypothetical protein
MALVHRVGPRIRGAVPLRGEVAEREPEQFRGGVIRGVVPARLDDFSELGVHALQRIGRVDQAADLWWKREEWHDVRPGAPPGGDHGGKLASPGSPFEFVESSAPDVGAGRGVDRPQGRREMFAFLPIAKRQTVANQVQRCTSGASSPENW